MVKHARSWIYIFIGVVFDFSKGDGTDSTHCILFPHIFLKVNSEDATMSKGCQ